MQSFFNTLYDTLLLQWTLLTWQDYVEIVVLAFLFYETARWLKQDREKNLLIYFYGYLLVIFASHGLHLTTLSSLLLLCSPATIMFFFIMHQEQLQKNFVSLKNITRPQQYPTNDWLSVLMKAILTQLAHNKSALILFEHSDAIAPHLSTSEPLEVAITPGIISLLFSQLYSPEHLCWVSSDGILKGINTSFKASWHPTSYQTKDAWIDDAVAHTSRTDCIILAAHADTHHYSIAHKGTIFEQLSLEQAQQFIRKQINYRIPHANQGYRHELTSQEQQAHHTP